jgi:hypothetical protein
MKIKIVLMAVFCMLLGVGIVAAQEKANFAGSWTLDVSKSKLSERSPIESMTMKVTQTDKEISVETKTVRKQRPEGEARGGMGRPGGGMMGGGDATRTYSLDGKETSADDVTLKSNFELDGKLKLIQTRSFEGPMGTVTIRTVETWQFADEGKTLKVTRDTETPRGKQSSEMVFTKN